MWHFETHVKLRLRMPGLRPQIRTASPGRSIRPQPNNRCDRLDTEPSRHYHSTAQMFLRDRSAKEYPAPREGETARGEVDDFGVRSCAQMIQSPVSCFTLKNGCADRLVNTCILRILVRMWMLCADDPWATPAPLITSLAQTGEHSSRTCK